MDTMIRVNQIWKHPIYQEQLQALQMLEADRKFCRHTPEHFLDVARLAYIHALESHASASKELIYCTALLHDIGRAEQYRSGIHTMRQAHRLQNRFYESCPLIHQRFRRSLLPFGNIAMPLVPIR